MGSSLLSNSMGTGTHVEPRNQWSVPRRSDNAAIASRYGVINVFDEMRMPEGGTIDTSPVAGGGGGVIKVCKEGPGAMLLDWVSEDHVKDNEGVMESDNILSR